MFVPPFGAARRADTIAKLILFLIRVPIMHENIADVMFTPDYVHKCGLKMYHTLLYIHDYSRIKTNEFVNIRL